MNKSNFIPNTNDFQIEKYVKSMQTKSTEIATIKDFNNRNAKLFLLAGALTLSVPCDFKILENSIRNESVLPIESCEEFLVAYNKNINAPLSQFSKEIAELTTQKKVSRKTIIKEIVSFEALKLNWDGYGAYPLEVESAANALELMHLWNKNVYECIDEVYPNPNGTISISWVNKLNEKLCLEIGNKSMSYYVEMCSKDTRYFNNVFINEFEAKKISEFVTSLV